MSRDLYMALEEDLENISGIFYDFTKQSEIFYIYTNPVVLDFTQSKPNQLIICNTTKKLELLLNRVNTTWIDLLLDKTILNQNKVLIAWDIKSWISFVRNNSKKLICYKRGLVDLKTLENYYGIFGAPPQDLKEAMKRFSSLPNDQWKSYQDHHLDLQTEVLPAMETYPLLDIEEKTTKYAHYELEGESNGRLKCEGIFKNSYNPHLMSDDVKKRLKPQGYDNIFLYADYNHCEVATLAWISKDPNLSQCLSESDDFYSLLWEIVVGGKTDEVLRQKSKWMFLPTIYGCGVKKLAEKLEMSFDDTKAIVGNLQKLFPVAFRYLQDAQKMAESDGVVTDVLGKFRKFNDKFYLARNFVVQSPAASFCLEHLRMLYHRIKDLQLLKLAFNIRDGYGLVVHEAELPKAMGIVKEVLERESEILPGLKMKTSIQYGSDLLSLRKV